MTNSRPTGGRLWLRRRQSARSRRSIRAARCSAVADRSRPEWRRQPGGGGGRARLWRALGAFNSGAGELGAWDRTDHTGMWRFWPMSPSNASPVIGDDGAGGYVVNVELEVRGRSRDKRPGLGGEARSRRLRVGRRVRLRANQSVPHVPLVAWSSARTSRRLEQCENEQQSASDQHDASLLGRGSQEAAGARIGGS
jgi:hypothetical protein